MEKPTLIFFSPDGRYKDVIPRTQWYSYITKIHDWLKWYFNLVVISRDCDLREVVKKHNPDMLLFDGLEAQMASIRFTVYNSDEHANIPRAGLIRPNIHSISDDANLELFERYKVSRIFVLGNMNCGAGAPGLREKLIYVPAFFDSNLFHDLKFARRIPVVMYGSFDYAFGVSSWAPQVYAKVVKNFPCLHIQRAREGNLNSGHVWLQTAEENYATLSSAVFAVYSSPLLSASPEEILYVAASGAVLISEDSAQLRALGFRHLENCLLSDVEDIEHDIKKLFCDKALLQHVVTNGQSLAHTKNTFMHRPQLLEWFNLERQRLPNQRIVQPSALQSLQCVPQNAVLASFHIEHGQFDQSLHKLDRLIASEDYERAERRCKEYLSDKACISTIISRLAFIQLLQLKAHECIKTLNQPVATRLNLGATQPDPVHWAMLLSGLFCMKDFGSLKDYLVLFEETKRVELDTVRWALCTALDDHEYAAKYRANLLNPEPQAVMLNPLGVFSAQKVLSLLSFLMEKYKMAAVIDYLWIRAREQGIIPASEQRKQFDIRTVANF